MARKTFTQDDLRAAMRGIEYRDTAAFVDEIPAAYKDIDQVMADVAALVEIRHTLRQRVNGTGDGGSKPRQPVTGWPHPRPRGRDHPVTLSGTRSRHKGR